MLKCFDFLVCNVVELEVHVLSVSHYCMGLSVTCNLPLTLANNIIPEYMLIVAFESCFCSCDKLPFLAVKQH